MKQKSAGHDSRLAKSLAVRVKKKNPIINTGVYRAPVQSAYEIRFQNLMQKR